MIDYFNVSDDSYILTLDSRHFDETILIDKNERIVPIKLRKIKKNIDSDTFEINILDIYKNNYRGYILYEIVSNPIYSLTKIIIMTGINLFLEFKYLIASFRYNSILICLFMKISALLNIFLEILSEITYLFEVSFKILGALIISK